MKEVYVLFDIDGFNNGIDITCFHKVFSSDNIQEKVKEYIISKVKEYEYTDEDWEEIEECLFKNSLNESGYYSDDFINISLSKKIVE